MKSFIFYLEKNKLFNERLATARSLLAFGALITLIFNNVTELTDFSLVFTDDTFIRNIPVNNFSIFEVFGLFWGKCFSIFILIIVFTGYLPQITCILQAWIHYSICNSFLIVEGGDQIASNLAILLIPICLFDNRINQWKPINLNNLEKRKVVNVFFNTYYFLIILQIAIVYLHAGIGKFYNEEWRDGTCAYYWFTHNVFGAPFWLQKIYSIITLSKVAPLFTWSIMIFELSLFACIFATNRKLRRLFLILGLFFHFGIIITHGLVSFFCSMAAALILYLDDENIVYKNVKNGYKKYI